MADTARTPAQIEQSIARRRQDLAATLDEIAVRVHPRTIVGDARARAAETVDRTTGKALSAVGRSLGGVRGQFVSEEGTPRLERVVPAALVVVAAVGLVIVASRRRQP